MPHDMCFWGNFCPKRQKNNRNLNNGQKLPGRDITCSLVGHLSGVLLLGRVDMAQYMFGAIFSPKDRKTHRHINIGFSIKGLFLGSTYKLIHFPGVFVTGMGRNHMIWVLGSFFIPKDRKPIESLVMANNYPGKEIKASVVRKILFPTLWVWMTIQC